MRQTFNEKDKEFKNAEKSGKSHKPFRKVDEKDYGIGAQILHSLKVK